MARIHNVPAGRRALLLGMAAVGMAAATVLQAEDRSAVLDNIRPIGQVNVAGASAPAADPAAAPVAVEAPPAAPAPAETSAEPAPVETAAAAPAPAAAADGQQVYQSACFACHGTGAAGAPKLGDQVAWEARVAKGKDTLLQHALNGFNAMPPRGGRMDLSDEQVSAAVDYMLDAL
jgi:cytochrome c5